MGVPPNCYYFLSWIFHSKPSSYWDYWGTPMTMEPPSCEHSVGWFGKRFPKRLSYFIPLCFLWVTCLISRISMGIPLFYVDTKLSDGLFAWTSMSFLLKNPSFLMKSPGFLQFSGRYPQRPPCPRRPSVSLFSGERVFRGESEWVAPDDLWRGCPVTGGRFRGMGCCKRFF